MAPLKVVVSQRHNEAPPQENKFVTRVLVCHVGHVLLGYATLGRQRGVRDNECIYNFSGKQKLGRPKIKLKDSLKMHPRNTVCKDRKDLDIMYYTVQVQGSVLALLYFWF
jgi:hypothetical protein